MDARFKWYRRILIWGVLALAAIPTAYVVYVGVTMPSFAELSNPDSENAATQVFSRDGVLLGSFYQHENRISLSVRDSNHRIPKHFLDALLCTEDVRFYSHSGVDPRAVANVFLSALLFEPRGGSTITQQLARNLYDEQVGKDRTILRKVKEAIVAVHLERNFTKGEILFHYLNTVSFGSTIYGLATASQYYFNKPCKDLLPHESALLVGLLKGPSRYSPYRYPQACLARRNTVLEQMYKYGTISEKELKKWKSMPLSVAQNRRQDHNEGLATYFRIYIRDWLKKWCEKCQTRIHRNGKLECPNMYTDGLRIYTTIDSRMQRHAEEATFQHLAEHQKKFNQYLKSQKNHVPWKKDSTILKQAMAPSERYKYLKSKRLSDEEIYRQFQIKREMRVFKWRDSSYKIGKKDTVVYRKHYVDTVMSPWDSLIYYAPFLEPGMLVVNHQNGHVLAWVGGIDYEYFQYDHVATAKRQVGSTFKPFVYTAAFDNNRSPCDVEPNEPITIEEYGSPPWTPKNVDGKYGGAYTLRMGLALSINVIAARLIKAVGPRQVVQYAHNMGIESPLEPYHSIALGTFDLSVAELTSAYATIAAGGVWHERILVTRIEDRFGNVIQEFPGASREGLSKETAYLMADVLRTVVTNGTAANLHYQYRVPQEIFVAGKTGTTQNHSDGWFCGFTPYYTAGVWVGCSDRRVNFGYSPLGQGGYMAMPIFAHFTRKVYQDPELNLDRQKRLIPPIRFKVETDCSKYALRGPESAPEDQPSKKKSKMDWDEDD